MALINRRTNLKSLRYGQDRPGGGDSGQPYIQSSVSGKLIDVNIGNLNVSIPIPNLGIFGRGTGGEDFLLRGGTQTPSRALKDVSRLTKMFFDTKSPKGVLFTIKQNMLSLSGVKTQGNGSINLNEGIYLPTSTIAQAAGNAFGFHLNKQGANPFRNTSPNSGGILPIISSPLLDIFGLPAYAQKVRSDQDAVENRLVQLKNKKITDNPALSLTDQELREAKRKARANIRNRRQAAQAAGTIDQFRDDRRNERKQDRKNARANRKNQNRLGIPDNHLHLLQYSGGPSSLLGIGQTTIRRYSDTSEGIVRANESLPDAKSPFGNTPTFNALNEIITSFISPPPEGEEYLESMPSVIAKSKTGLIPFISQNSPLFPFFTFSRTKVGLSNTNEGLDFLKNLNLAGRYYVLNSTDVRNKPSSKDNTLPLQDFRTTLLPQQARGFKKNILARAPSYQDKNIEQRVSLGDPGKREKNTTSYARGLFRPDGTRYGALDKITAMPLYQTSGVADHGGDRNDLVKFSIGIINNDGEPGSPLKRTFIHFRAFLDSMDDTYAAEWNDFRYMGRGEKFYRYNGFTRTINLGWTVAAQSKEELIPMYQKLNFLASSLAPDYSTNGYMRGNLAVLTVGGYIYDQPGIINGLTYTVPQESPWEIGINDSISSYGYDTTVKEVPHIIKVTGFSFTPIHKFVPGLQKNTYGGDYTDVDGGVVTNVISEWEAEKGRFIPLTTSTGDQNNYDANENYTWGEDGKARRKKEDEKGRLSIFNPNPNPLPTFEFPTISSPIRTRAQAAIPPNPPPPTPFRPGPIPP